MNCNMLETAKSNNWFVHDCSCTFWRRGQLIFTFFITCQNLLIILIQIYKLYFCELSHTLSLHNSHRLAKGYFKKQEMATLVKHDLSYSRITWSTKFSIPDLRFLHQSNQWDLVCITLRPLFSVSGYNFTLSKHTMKLYHKLYSKIPQL